MFTETGVQLYPIDQLPIEKYSADVIRQLKILNLLVGEDEASLPNDQQTEPYFSPEDLGSLRLWRLIGEFMLADRNASAKRKNPEDPYTPTAILNRNLKTADLALEQAAEVCGLSLWICGAPGNERAQRGAEIAGLYIQNVSKPYQAKIMPLVHTEKSQRDKLPSVFPLNRPNKIYVATNLLLNTIVSGKASTNL